MTVEPVNPGPLVMSDSGQPVVVALNLVAETASPPDHGIIAEVFNFTNRPDWEGYAAWLVRASHNHEALVILVRELIASQLHARSCEWCCAKIEVDELGGDLSPLVHDIDCPAWIGKKLLDSLKVRAVLDSLAQATGAPEAGDPK